jgi:hypothetical protein
MAIEPAHDDQDVTITPSIGDGARTWKGWLIGVLALSFGAAKLVVHLHAAHRACEFLGFCN